MLNDFLFILIVIIFFLASYGLLEFCSQLMEK
jgi:hypothetical protein